MFRLTDRRVTGGIERFEGRRKEKTKEVKLYSLLRKTFFNTLLMIPEFLDNILKLQLLSF